nr:unnamed protein product [Haemonchus contortus]
MVDEKDDIIIVDEVTSGKGNAINGTDTKGGSESGKDGAEVNRDKAWVPSDEKESKDHGNVVVIDECGEGDEFLESAAKSAEQPEKAEGNVQSLPGRKKKERTYKRKVVRLPREVFDYMAKIEEDGTIRINVTQFAIFFTNEISKKFTAVPAESWVTSDLVPMMDVSVPPTAKENQFLIVDNFSNEPKERAAQEKRLKDLLENRRKFAEQKMQREQEIATGAKILPADGKANAKKKPQKNAGEQVKAEGTNEEKSPSKCVYLYTTVIQAL